MLKPFVGAVVQYTLTENDARKINRRRTTRDSILDRIRNNGMTNHEDESLLEQWPMGVQAHVGNTHYTGDILPLVVVRVWPDGYGEGEPGVNGQVLLDGSDQFWVTSVEGSYEPRQGRWNFPI